MVRLLASFIFQHLVGFLVPGCIHANSKSYDQSSSSRDRIPYMRPLSGIGTIIIFIKYFLYLRLHATFTIYLRFRVICAGKAGKRHNKEEVDTTYIITYLQNFTFLHYSTYYKYQSMTRYPASLLPPPIASGTEPRPARTWPRWLDGLMTEYTSPSPYPSTYDMKFTNRLSCVYKFNDYYHNNT